MTETETWLNSIKSAQGSRVGMTLTYDERDPDEAARNLSVAKGLGVPSIIVDSEPEAYRAQLDAKRASEALSSAPKTAAWLTDMGNGVLAKDDVENLSWFERGLKDFGGAASPFFDMGRASRRFLERVPGAAQKMQAFSAASVIADVGKTFDELVAEEIAQIGGDRAPTHMRATAIESARIRLEAAKGLTQDDVTALIREGADALVGARAAFDKAASIPMSDDATAFRDGNLQSADNSIMGVLKAFADNPRGGTKFVVETAAEFLPAMVAASAVTAATRSPTAGAAVMGGASFMTEDSAAAMEFIAEKGLLLTTPEAAAVVLRSKEIMQEARDRGLSRGLVIGIMDAVSGGVAGKALAKSPIGDVIAQGIAQMAFGAAGEAGAQLESGQEIGWADIIIEGLAELATAPVEVLGVGGRRFLKASVQNAKSGRTAGRLTEAEAQAIASKLRERAPDKFKEALDAQGLGDQAVYVPADALREYFQAKDLSLDEETMRAWGIDPLTFEEAAAAGTDVGIPLSNYATYIAGSEDAAWFKENATTDPEEMSLAMAKEFNASVQEIMMEAFDEAERERLSDLEMRAADVQIYDQVFGQLRAAGRSPDVAKSEASIWAAFWRTMGERYGEDPLDLARSMGVDIRGPQSEVTRRRDQLDIALNTLRTKGALKPQGLSLAEFIKAKGGVQDEGGDVAAVEPPKGVVAESDQEIKARKSQPSLDGLPSEGKGVNLEDMARMAVEAGYFPDLMAAVADGQMDGIVDRLVQALRDDVSGRKVYAEGEGPDAALQALSEALSERGLDPATMTNDEIAIALDKPDVSPESNVVDAAHRIAQKIRELLPSVAGSIKVEVRADDDPRWSQNRVALESGVEIHADAASSGGTIYIKESTPPHLVAHEFRHILDIVVVGLELRDAIAEMEKTTDGRNRLHDYLNSARDAGIIPSDVYFANEAEIANGLIAAYWADPNSMEAAIPEIFDILFDSRIDEFSFVNDEIAAAMEADPDGLTYNQDGTLMTDTPEFAAWFGDSKVVDENGKPLVVYHSTNKTFDRFDPEKVIGSQFWFTDDRAAIDAGEVGAAGRGIVMEVYLSLQNPAGWAEYDKFGIDELIGRGFDGLKLTEKDGTATYVAFRPTQIKSVNNRGTFDPNDPRILYQSQDAAVTLHALANEGNSEAVVAQALIDRLGLSVENLANVLVGVSLGAEPDGLVGAPSLVSVMAQVRGAIAEDPKVLDAVIGLVPVDVMNDLFGSQAAAKMALHDQAVLKDSAAFNADLPVSGGRSDAASSVRLLVSEAARAAAERLDVALGSGREAAEGRAALFAGESKAFRQGEKRASIIFGKDGVTSTPTIINLFETADLSSFLHESGHFFLEAFNTLASDENAPQSMKDDLAAILDWFGVKSWSEVGVKHHEQWARGFEAYAMEGKAPSLALADAFARFKAWLTRIYRSIAGLDVKITPQIREVMDRMLATDAEIAEARAEMGMRPLFADAPPGMSDGDFATYQRMARRSTEQAEQALLEKAMAKVRREKEAWFREEKQATRAEVQSEFDRRREYRLIDMLANQTWNGLDESGNARSVPDMQIDRKMLIEQFGEGVIPEISRTRLGGKRAIYGDTGISPEEVAEFFGFQGASEMIAILQNTAKKQDAVAAEVDRRMSERHGDPLNDGSIEEEALVAIHNEQQMNLSVSEARHMAKQLGRNTRNMQAKVYRQRARSMIGRMTVRDAIRAERFLAAERKAAKAAQAAFARVAKGKGEAALSEALQAKEQQILNGFLYDEARKIAQEVQKGREKMRGYGKNTVREKLAGGYIEQIDAILQDYDFRVRGQGQVARSESLKAFVDRMIEEGREGELSIDERLMNEAGRRHYTRLSVDELRGLFDTIDNIDHLGRFKQKLIDRNRKRELRASVDRLVEQIRGNLGSGKSGEKSKVAAAFNLLWRTDTLLQRIDAGEEIGPAYDEIKRSIDEATSVEQEMHVEMAERLDKLFKDHYSAADLRKMRVERDIPGGNGRAWSKMEILSVALNTGNEDNFIRLTAKDAAQKNRLTRDQVDALLATMDERDWRFVQDMWGMIDSYWSGLSEVAQRRTGVTPKKVEAKLMVDAPSFVTGGYYPIKYDPNLSAAAAADEASGWDKFTATGRGATAAIRNGMTIQRQKSGNGRTLRLDLSVAFAHMRDTIRYTALSEAVDNTYRLLAHPDVQNAFLDAGAKDQAEILRLWLKDVASGPAPSPDPVNTVSRIIKNNFTLSRLALNFKTVALQVTGVGQSAVVIGKRNLARGFMEYLRNPTGTAAEVIEKSAFMSERRSTFQKDIYDFMDDTQIAGPVSSTYKKGKATLAKIGFAPIVWTQFWAVDMPTWLGAFRAGIEKYGDEAKAIHFADRMVARAQDSGLMADRAAFERGTLSESQRQSDWVRLFTTLGGYMLTKMNRAYVTTIQARTAWRSTDSNAQRVAIAIGAATNLGLLYLTEAIMIGLIYSLMADDEDDDDLKRFLLRETGSAVVGGIPFIRDAYAGLLGYGGGGIYGSVAEAPANFIRQAAQGENDAALRRSIADIIGTVTGLPTTGPMRAIEGALDDDIPLSEAIFGRNPLGR